ncbi:MAG: N-acetylmuramoyl-L-alanine amidase [Clostridia bacterium]|nr:N-acetylmuramoyl-L-alanine amidase [Clostridia bacterium]
MRGSAPIKQAMLTVASLLLCGGVLAAVLGTLPTTAPTRPVQAAVAPLITVDAGHGGADGGAVAPDGTAEKTLNLAIAQKLTMMLRFCGYRVRMTREGDDSIHDAESVTIREKKVSDMNNRLQMFEESDRNISIHQNMFGSARYHGAQVFYSTNDPASEELATAIRDSIVGWLQPDNTREIKPGSRDIFLLYKTTKPTVLVECGFLSNAEELALLKDPAYQQQLAFAIACGVITQGQPPLAGLDSGS